MPQLFNKEESRVHGRAALEAVGIPLEFAAQIMLLAHSLGVAIAIRAGKPFQLYKDLCAPKPSFVKAKTGTWGFAKGVIPENYRLGKMDASGNVLIPPDIPDEVIFTQHKISLGEILSGLRKKSPEYQLISLDPCLTPQEYIKQYHRLVVVPTVATSPKENKIIFSIDLEKGSPPLKIDVGSIRTHLFETTHKCPSWWNTKWGKFSDCLNYRYPADYQESLSDEIQPLKIYAIHNSEKKSVPITGDMDLLWMTRPSERYLQQHLLRQFPPSALRVLNTANVEDSDQMLKALIELHTHFAEQRDELFDITKIKDESIGRTGCITPLESFFITNINERFAKFAPHITNLFQHGAENRNPGMPSDIDGRMLHIWHGEFVLTESEKDLVDFVLNTPGYLENNIIDVHPKWNMNLWAPVINKQISLRQSIRSDVLEKYKKYIDSFWNVKNFVTKLFFPFLLHAPENNDHVIDVIRGQHEGSYIEKKCFTARACLSKLEDICKDHAGWSLDKIEKRLHVNSEHEHIIIQLEADHIISNSNSSTAMAILIAVAQALEIVNQKIIVHSPKEEDANRFQLVWNEMADPKAIEKNNNLDHMIAKIDLIISLGEKLKLEKPVQYHKLDLFSRKQPRKLSFNADAKAQRAWMSFFNKKSSDMNPEDKDKFMESQVRVNEIMNLFNRGG